MRTTEAEPLSEDSRFGHGQLVLGIGLAIVAAVALRVLWSFVVDDAFITFRYSAHLAHGHGPVWNIKGERVEGFTNFLWMAVLAVPAALGLSLVVTAKLISCACLLGTAIYLHRTVGRLTDNAAAAWLSVCSLLLFAPTYLHTLSGLETMGYAFLVVALVGETLLAARYSSPSTWRVAALALLTGLMRPEGAVVGAVCCGYLLFVDEEGRRKDLAAFVLAFVLPGLIYFAWRYSFYGYPFPNTFYVKAGHLRDGIKWAGSQYQLFGPVGLLWVATSRARGWRPTAFVLIAIAAAELPFVLSTPGIDYARRYAFHSFPVLCLILGLVAGDLAKSRWRFTPIAVLVIFALVGIRAMSPALLLTGRDMRQSNLALGHSLGDAAIPQQYRSVALGNAGAIPYFADSWLVTDYIGLNNAAIAHGQSPTQVVLAADPVVVILYSVDGRTPFQFQHGLEPEAIVSTHDSVGAVEATATGWLLVYERRGLPNQVRSQIDAAVKRARQQFVGGDLGWHDFVRFLSRDG